MRAGRLWVLLLLAAVFSMHGLQCMVTDSGTGHADVGFASVLTLASPDGAAVAVAGAHPGSAQADLVHSGPPSADQGAPAHGAAHALAVCLAVVLTGMTFLGARPVLRSVTTSASAEREPGPARLWSAGAHPLRPPDLAALCLLRI